MTRKVTLVIALPLVQLSGHAKHSASPSSRPLEGSRAIAGSKSASRLLSKLVCLFSAPWCSIQQLALSVLSVTYQLEQLLLVAVVPQLQLHHDGSLSKNGPCPVFTRSVPVLSKLWPDRRLTLSTTRRRRATPRQSTSITATLALVREAAKRLKLWPTKLCCTPGQLITSSKARKTSYSHCLLCQHQLPTTAGQGHAPKRLQDTQPLLASHSRPAISIPALHRSSSKNLLQNASQLTAPPPPWVLLPPRPLQHPLLLPSLPPAALPQLLLQHLLRAHPGHWAPVPGSLALAELGAPAPPRLLALPPAAGPGLPQRGPRRARVVGPGPGAAAPRQCLPCLLPAGPTPGHRARAGAAPRGPV